MFKEKTELATVYVKLNTHVFYYTHVKVEHMAVDFYKLCEFLVKRADGERVSLASVLIFMKKIVMLENH